MMRKQIFSLMLSAAIFTTNPLFAMDLPEDKESGSQIKAIFGPLTDEHDFPAFIEVIKTIIFSPISRESNQFIAAKLGIRGTPNLHQEFKDYFEPFYNKTLFKDMDQSYTVSLRTLQSFRQNRINGFENEDDGEIDQIVYERSFYGYTLKPFAYEFNIGDQSFRLMDWEAGQKLGELRRYYLDIDFSLFHENPQVIFKKDNHGSFESVFDISFFSPLPCNETEQASAIFNNKVGMVVDHFAESGAQEFRALNKELQDSCDSLIFTHSMRFHFKVEKLPQQVNTNGQRQSPAALEKLSQPKQTLQKNSGPQVLSSLPPATEKKVPQKDVPEQKERENLFGVKLRPVPQKVLVKPVEEQEEKIGPKATLRKPNVDVKATAPAQDGDSSSLFGPRGGYKKPVAPAEVQGKLPQPAPSATQQRAIRPLPPTPR